MPSSSSERWKRSWPWLRRALTAAFFIGLIALLAQRIRSIDWDQVGNALIQLQPSTLVIAAVLAILSYTLYACFDLIGRRYTHHKLGPRVVIGTALVSYAFNLNFGALVGGIGFRYRLYSRNGLQKGTITRVLFLSMLSNWLGYGPLLALVLFAGAVVLPDASAWIERLLLIVGLVALLPAPAYVAWCIWTRRRIRMLRGMSIRVPPAGMALLQLTLSICNWLSMAAIVWVLLGMQVDYAVVLGALLLAAVAGVITHVPAGLGVLEAVFMALLAGRVAEAPLLAALLAYRAIYYLLPGAIALLAYLGMEARIRHRAVAA